MSGELLIAVKCVLLIVVVSIGMSWPNEVVVDRGDFDIISDRYLSILSMEKGLNDAKQSELIQELTKEGFENITITAPKTAEWGDEVTLTVVASMTYDRLKGLDYEKETHEMNYENSTIISGLGVN